MSRFVRLARTFHSSAAKLDNAFKFVSVDGVKETSVTYTVPSKPRLGSDSTLTVKPQKTYFSRFQESRAPEMERKRVVPEYLTHYSSNPAHEKNIFELRQIQRKYKHLPTVNAKEDSGYRWLNFSEYELIGGGTRLKPLEYKKLVAMLQQLNSIDKQLVSEDLIDILNKYRKPTANSSKTQKVKQLDEFGRAVAVGGRKTSSAKVYLVRGEGKFIVNGEPLNVFFPRLSDRQKIMFPLSVVDAEGKYNVFVKTRGGGVTGKVGAIAHGIAQCLVIFNPLLKPRLRKAGCMTRDSRTVERKKPGKVKSRKSPTWVKR